MTQENDMLSAYPDPKGVKEVHDKIISEKIVSHDEAINKASAQLASARKAAKPNERQKAFLEAAQAVIDDFDAQVETLNISKTKLQEAINLQLEKEKALTKPGLFKRSSLAKEQKKYQQKVSEAQKDLTEAKEFRQTLVKSIEDDEMLSQEFDMNNDGILDQKDVDEFDVEIMAGIEASLQEPVKLKKMKKQLADIQTMTESLTKKLEETVTKIHAVELDKTLEVGAIKSAVEATIEDNLENAKILNTQAQDDLQKDVADLVKAQNSAVAAEKLDLEKLKTLESQSGQERRAAYFGAITKAVDAFKTAWSEAGSMQTPSQQEATDLLEQRVAAQESKLG